MKRHELISALETIMPGSANTTNESLFPIVVTSVAAHVFTHRLEQYYPKESELIRTYLSKMFLHGSFTFEPEAV